MAYGLLKTPGSFGADLVAGEGQSLGLTKSFGGPGLGLLAGTKKQMRNLPGRLIGKTRDANGQEGFVLTLATREQHIRREKASSNICSNNGLNAMTAAMYLATVGKIGIREIAQQNHDKAQYLKTRLLTAGFESVYDTPFFNEFVLKAPKGFEQKRTALIQDKCIFAGVNLEPFYPELKHHYLFCATETLSKKDIDQLAKEVQ
jgi:glycine dehydrogenase subunit 1